ncbi:ThuA domain-containing protein [Maribellus maritimus]|uniref:ThuA domain-containing protein n=1 Tax=Maribellus maritimus TaxID=2870838 RepID=UPI001EEC417F|nr:ThuA domain-containing protein [Maribellus maritimus]MCG6188530.1 ThuA domain-containing protein [Maribellus maritimus]
MQKEKYTRFVQFVLVVIFLLSATTGIASKKSGADDLPSLKGKKVLMVWGGWNGHFPKELTEKVLAFFKEEGAIVTVSDSLGVYTNKELMGDMDLIFQSWTMGQITSEQEKGLLAAIKNGAGLAGTHGGLGDSFRNNTEYQFMVGGQWVAHPGGVIDYSVQVTDKKDPLTKGLDDFDIKSEQYYMHVDPNVKVLATTTISGEHAEWATGAVIPVVWKKYFGEGRVFYISVGHTPADFDIPEAWEILKRGIKWASGSKYLPKEEWVSPVYPGQ